MDNKSKALGYLIGKQIAGMRRVTKEPVAYLYNGVRLPKLPEWDREMYPYAVISKGATGSTYKLSVFAGNAYSFKDDNLMYFGGQSDVESVKCAVSLGPLENGWEEFKEYDNNRVKFGPGISIATAIWANCDLEYEGTVYLESSDPIPVYE